MSFGTVLAGIGNVLGGLATGVSSIVGTVDQVKTNDLNYQLQKDNLAYQKDLQKIMFAREDNAVTYLQESYVTVPIRTKP